MFTNSIIKSELSHTCSLISPTLLSNKLILAMKTYSKVLYKKNYPLFNTVASITILKSWVGIVVNYILWRGYTLTICAQCTIFRREEGLWNLRAGRWRRWWSRNMISSHIVLFRNVLINLLLVVVIGWCWFTTNPFGTYNRHCWCRQLMGESEIHVRRCRFLLTWFEMIYVFGFSNSTKNRTINNFCIHK